MQRNYLSARSAAAPRRIASFDIAPDGLELALMSVGTLLSLTMYWAGAYALSNVLTPFMILATLGWGIWRMLHRVPAAIWSSLFAVRVGSLVFIGIGGLVPILGGEAAREYILALYPYSPEEAAKAHALYIAGLLVLFGAIKGASMVQPSIKPLRHITFTWSSTFRLGVIFVAIGLGYLMLIQIPTQLYWTGFVLPGVVMLLVSSLASIGLFLLTLWAAERGGAAYLIPALLLFIQLLVSAILLEKSTFLMAVLLIGLAVLLRRFSIPRLAILAAALGVALSFMSAAIQQARIIHTEAYGDPTGGTVGERLGYQIRYLEGERIAFTVENEATTFVRLHYTSPSTFVMAQYDFDMPSDSIANSVYALVPRIIWPDKPLTSAAGGEINRMITGADTSALGVVMFADLYWNFGWTGLLLLLPVGWYLWWSSCVAVAVVSTRDWLMMPFVVVAFRIGISIDNTFVLSWFVPAVISLLMFAMLRLVAEIILSPQKKGIRRHVPTAGLIFEANNRNSGSGAAATRAR